MLTPYTANYSPLLTMKRNKKHQFEEKTPELILIEQLLHIKADDTIEDTIGSDVLNSKENEDDKVSCQLAQMFKKIYHFHLPEN